MFGIGIVKRYIMHQNIFCPIYKEEYTKGFSEGLNPHSIYHNQTKAYTSGFDDGRQEYESMNGYIRNGVPQLIVTTKIVEDFLLAGLLGLYIDYDGYNSYQLYVLEKWYLSGIEKYDHKQSGYLIDLLEKNGIELNMV